MWPRFFLGNLSGSIAMEANAWHSFSDVFVSSIVFVGLLVARLGASKLKQAVDKVENILAIIVSFFIFYMGIELLSDALSSEGVELQNVPFVAAGAFVGVIINYFMARYKIYVGEQTKSRSLTADGYHSKMDMYCSIAVLVGLLGSLFGMRSLDKIAAIVAMVFLVISGFEILVSNVRALTGRSDGHDEDGHAHLHFNFRNGKKVLLGAGSLLAVAYMLSGVYIVNWNEVGIVQRFGAVVGGDVNPGLHYRLPYPFEQVTIIQKDTVRKVETGNRELLTGDTNLIDVALSVHYKVKDAQAYALNVSNLDTLVQASTSTSIRSIVGSREIDYLLTEGKEEIESKAKEMLQDVMDRNQTGIDVVGVQVVNIAPPAAVLASFQDLASARQDKAIYINEATAYQNTIIPQANGDAYKQLREAEGYKDEKVKTAEGDATLFIERQGAYAASRDVTQLRLYMEAMDKILPNVQKILMGGDVSINNAELWISNKKSGGYSDGTN